MYNVAHFIWTFQKQGRRLGTVTLPTSLVLAGLLGAAHSCGADVPKHSMIELTAEENVQVERFANNPLLEVGDQPGLEENINGPSVIRVPDWVDEPKGKYYLYFAHHKGEHIRLAYADDPEGPFEVFEPGTLSLAESGFPENGPAPENVRYFGSDALDYAHIASPDVHVVPEREEIRMYYHGLDVDGYQYTRVAVSTNGIDFKPVGEPVGPAYFRAFRYDDMWYAMAMPGVIYRSEDGLVDFEEGPTLFDSDMRHSAVLVRGQQLHVFFSRAGDAPESILHSVIDMRGDWHEWRESPETLLLSPETEWEGADQPVRPSERGASTERVHQLRDPAILEHDGTVYLYYSIAGEYGMAGARILCNEGAVPE